uniref:EF-hand domain-containing protein n=1 Tax=Heliothis virescens TaxID=7102 RepID=A0A2A4JN57_HELVI
MSQPTDSMTIPEVISVCKCLISGDSSTEEVKERESKRKRRIFTTVSRTEKYLRERRIPELIRFIFVKILAANPTNPALFVERLMNDCMICRSGLGLAPVLFEDRHLEAVVKSFDPCNRGWLSAGQVRRAFITLGLTPEAEISDKTPTQDVYEKLRETQKKELFDLLSAGSDTTDEFCNDLFLISLSIAKFFDVIDIAINKNCIENNPANPAPLVEALGIRDERAVGYSVLPVRMSLVMAGSDC